jgi:hypothetical protein
VNGDNHLIVDSQNDAVRRGFLTGGLRNISPIWRHKSGTVQGPADNTLIYVRGVSNRTKIVEQTCFLLDNGQGYNFANWHMYVYPRLFAYFSAGLHEQNVKLVVYQNTNPRLLEILRGFGLDPDNFFLHDEHEVSLFTDIYVPSAMSNVERLLAPEAFTVYDRVTEPSLVKAGLNPTSTWSNGSPPKKVYLSRSDVPRRKMLNEARIESIARECGYEIVLAASLTVLDTLRLFRSVDVICGPSGSTFLNMLYMKQGAHAIMISHPLYSPTAYLCCQFGGLRNISVSIIFGKVEGGESVSGYQEPFSADEDAVRQIMTAL